MGETPPPPAFVPPPVLPLDDEGRVLTSAEMPDFEGPQILRIGLYQHTKSRGLYFLQDVYTHTETREPMAAYIGPEGEKWVRPLGMFMETLADGKPRFRFIGKDLKKIDIS